MNTTIQASTNTQANNIAFNCIVKNWGRKTTVDFMQSIGYDHREASAAYDDVMTQIESEQEPAWS